MTENRVADGASAWPEQIFRREKHAKIALRDNPEPIGDAWKFASYLHGRLFKPIFTWSLILSLRRIQFSHFRVHLFAPRKHQQDLLRGYSNGFPGVCGRFTWSWLLCVRRFLSAGRGRSDRVGAHPRPNCRPYVLGEQATFPFCVAQSR